jgi:hypothetical protein
MPGMRAICARHREFDTGRTSMWYVRPAICSSYRCVTGVGLAHARRNAARNVQTFARRSERDKRSVVRILSAHALGSDFWRNIAKKFCPCSNDPQALHDRSTGFPQGGMPTSLIRTIPDRGNPFPGARSSFGNHSTSPFRKPETRKPPPDVRRHSEATAHALG